MNTFKVSPLAKNLRALADSVESRLWIVSPYIGSWKSVRRILGDTWEKVDVRLLTDKDSGILARDTLERFAVHRPIRSLTGVHAKLYIADETVLLTSANLTEMAFTRRYEAGCVLTGKHAQDLVAFYESLWDSAEDVDLELIKFTKSRRGNIDENSHGAGLTKLYGLPAAPAASTKGTREFADYSHFLEVYRDFVDAYLQAGRRDSRKLPLYLETDKFLNYLFHDDPKTPSFPYKKKAARVLSERERQREIKKYRARFRKTNLQTTFHLKNSRNIRKLLAKSKVSHLNAMEVATVAGSLNCFGMALAKARFLKSNDLATIRKAWFELIHGSADLKLRMNRCREMLYGFGKSAIQETLGYYDPKKFPLRNENTNAGLRFLGYKV